MPEKVCLRCFCFSVIRHHFSFYFAQVVTGLCSVVLQRKIIQLNDGDLCVALLDEKPFLHSPFSQPNNKNIFEGLMSVVFIERTLVARQNGLR